MAIFKNLYQLLTPLFFLKIIRGIGTPSFYKYFSVKGKFKTPLYNGEIIVLSSKHSFYIEKEIFWNGIHSEFEPFSLEIWYHLSKHSTSIFDIGANTGVFSMVAGKVTSGQVHSFEPFSFNYEALNRNKGLNSFNNVHLNQEGLSNEIGTASMYIKKDEVNYMNSVNKNRYGAETEVEEITIQLNTLSNYLSSNNLHEIDLMKIDVEGHEVEVLEGFIEELKKNRPTILIEVLDQEMSLKLNSMFDQLNYSYFEILETERKLIKKQSISTDERANYLIVCNE